MNIYTGLMRLSPIRGSSEDGFVDYDKELIKKSIRALVLTHRGSRIYDPNYGTNLHRIIHERNINRIRNIVKTEITEVIDKYEPRVNLRRIEAYAVGESTQEILVIMTLFYIEFDSEEIMELKFSSDTEWVKSDTEDKFY